MDYYLEDKSRLKGQPKRTISDYVEQNGILVPKRFNTLEEADASGLPLIARSEHPQDYDGMSGVLSSPKDLPKYLKKFPRNEEEIKKIAIGSRISNQKVREGYNLDGLDIEDYAKNLTFSYWELIGGENGYNQTVVADSSIKGRHHVMTYRRPREGNNNSFYSWVITQDGQEIKELVCPIDDGPKSMIPKLVETYERIRKLERFDPNNCPIIEFEAFEEKEYFLQYHRGKEFKASEFEIEGTLEEGEIEAELVNGATAQEGENVSVDISRLIRYNNSRIKYLDEIKYVDLPRRSIEIIDINKNYRLTMLRQFLNNHAEKSLLFKPKVSVIFEIDKLLPKGEGRLNLKITSDGRRALIKRLG